MVHTPRIRPTIHHIEFPSTLESDENRSAIGALAIHAREASSSGRTKLVESPQMAHAQNGARFRDSDLRSSSAACGPCEAGGARFLRHRSGRLGQHNSAYV